MAKKRQKKKRAAPRAGDSHLRKQERLEARRRAKEEALIARQRRERRERLVRTTGLVALVALAVWFFFLRPTSPDSIEGHEIASFPNLGSGEHGPPYNYETKPPVAGNHAPDPAGCGTHAEPIPDENLVHSLEHGAVAILYQPNEVPLEVIRDIESLVSDTSADVLSAPYLDMPDPITVVSWTRKMGLDSFDRSAVEEYIDVFADTEPAPEAGQEQAECENVVDDRFELPEPEASPTPEAGKQGEGKDNRANQKDKQGADKEDKPGANE